MHPLPPRTLFWDVDTQFDFMDPGGCLPVPGAAEIEPALLRLGAWADTAGCPVLASADDHEAGDAELSLDPDFVTTYPPHCLRGTAGAARVPATQRAWTATVGHQPLDAGRLDTICALPRPQILVLKKRFDVFSNPNTTQILRRLAPPAVVLYGVALDVCVRCALEGLQAAAVPRLCLVADATRPLDAARGADLVAAWRAGGVEITDSLAIAALTPQGVPRFAEV